MAAPELWLLRHGDAEPENGADADRRLTDRGKREARDAGRALARLGVHFEAVYASPRVRALETARLACGALPCEPVVHQPLSGGFDAGEARALIGSLSAADGRLLVVGHEPDFSQVIQDLTGARVALKKGGLAAVRVRGGGGELLALLRPGELAALAGGS